MILNGIGNPEMFEKVKEANLRLKGFANVTHVMRSRTLNDFLGAEVVFKCENFKRMGAFKFRGALNCISLLSEFEKKSGVVAFFSGNHVQAVVPIRKC